MNSNKLIANNCEKCLIKDICDDLNKNFFSFCDACTKRCKRYKLNERIPQKNCGSFKNSKNCFFEANTDVWKGEQNGN